jgi:hypothetical protein
VTDDEFRAWVVQSRRTRKLPDTIEDPGTLTRLARLVVQARPVVVAGRDTSDPQEVRSA